MRRLLVVLALTLLTAGAMPSCSDLESPGVAPRPTPGSFQSTTIASGAPPYGETVDLVAGRTLDIGSVHCWIVGNSLHILYAPEGDWRLKETHLIVASSVLDIPMTPTGNPKVGHFPLKQEYESPSPECEFTLDMNEWGFENAEELVIAAHAGVALLAGDGSILREEGAWGAGSTMQSTQPDDKYAIEVPSIKKDKTGIIKDDPPGRGNWAMYFTVNVKKLRGLILWNKLGSMHEVTHSVVGPNGIIVGDLEFLACTYGNGFKPLERTGDHNIPDNFIDFQGLMLGPRGCIEFWYHPTWSNWSVGHIVDPLWYGIVESTGNSFLVLHYNDWQGYLCVSGSEYTEGVEKDFVPGAIPGWSTAQPFHVGLVWDGTLPGGIDRVRFFINGSEATPARQFLIGNPDFMDWSPQAVLRMGSRLSSGDWNRHNWEGSEGIIDNLKVWSYPKTDFSDRFAE